MNTPTDILYVEDNEDYIDFMKRALRKAECNVSLTAVTDGKSALTSVKTSTTTASRYKLILLDIHLPGINGIELLQRIREQKEWTKVPIIMLSTSDNPKDVENCYTAGANAYVIKPVGIAPLTNTMKSLCEFWLNCNYSDQN